MPAESYLGSALWGLLLLACFAGWGRWIATLLRVRERSHAGLEIVWGFALVLALGGWLCYLSLAGRAALTALVALGLSGFLLHTVSAPPLAVPAARLGARAITLRSGLALLSIGVLGLSFALGLFDPRYQGGDDRAAYFLHAKQILQTGTLIEPFSFRRIASFGGQSFLQAMLLVVTPIEQLNLLDKGICRVAIGIALIAYALTGPNRSLLAALVVAYAVGVYFDFATNTASLFSGVLAFTGLWMTLASCRHAPERPLVNGVLTGLAAAATVPLRQNYVLACALIVLFEHLSRYRAAPRRYDWRELSSAVGSAALCVGGWALLQLRSCGTPLFPVLRGFANPEWDDLFAANGFDEFLGAFGRYLDYRYSAAPIGLVVLALGLPRRSADEASLRLPAAAALLAFGVNAWLLAHSHPHELGRYTVAFLLPTVLFASAHAAAILGRVRSASALRDFRPWLSAVYLLALLTFLPPTTRLWQRALWLPEEMSGRVEAFPDDALGVDRSALLQAAVPPGERLLVMLDRPYLLDLQRNAVASLDLPGAVSPPPGLFQIETPQEVVWYFHELGYFWLAAIRPSQSEELYQRRRWIQHASGRVQNWQYDASDAVPWQTIGRTILRFYRQLDVITQSCRREYEDGTLVLVDLRHCRFEQRR